MNPRTPTYMGYYTIVKLRKQVAMQGRPILLLVLMGKGLVDHQLRRVSSVLSTQFEMKMVLMSMCVKRHSALCMDLGLRGYTC